MRERGSLTFWVSEAVIEQWLNTGHDLLLAKLHCKRQHFQRLCVIWVDGGYRGTDFMKWVMDTYRWVIEVIKRSDTAQGFVLLPRRWVVERTFG